MDEPVRAEPPAPDKRGCFTVVLGIVPVLVLVGIPMLICPGPGTAAVAAGLGTIGLGLKRSMEE